MRQTFALALAATICLLAGACTSSHPDTYTNVAAPTEGGKTVVGKVVSFTDSTVTIETVTGQETLGMTTSTRGRDLLVVGANLGFAFERSSGRGEPVVTVVTANPSEPEPH